MSSLVYSEADAMRDVDMYLTEVHDFSTYMSLDGEVEQSKQTSTKDSEIFELVSNHLKNLRYVQYAGDMVDVIGDEMDDNWEVIDSYGIENRRFSFVDDFSDVHQDQWPVRISVADIYKQAAIDSNKSGALSILPAVKLLHTESEEAQWKQLKKDIERDRLLVNSIRLVGAAEGLDNVLQKLEDICTQLLTDCYLTHPPIEALNSLCKCALQKAARTHSGGIAFQALQNSIDPSTMMLIPQSSVTPPLKINVFIGRLPSTVKSTELRSKVGLICQVQSESIYQVSKRVDLNTDVSAESSSNVDTDHNKMTPLCSGLLDKIVSVMYEDYAMLEVQQQQQQSKNDDAEVVINDLLAIGQVVIKPTVCPKVK